MNTHELSTASAGEALSEEQSQPFYDLAWKHGARRFVSFAGDELESLSFGPSEFEAFCVALAASPAPGRAPLTEAELLGKQVWFDRKDVLTILAKAGIAPAGGIGGEKP